MLTASSRDMFVVKQIGLISQCTEKGHIPQGIRVLSVRECWKGLIGFGLVLRDFGEGLGNVVMLQMGCCPGSSVIL